MTTPHRNEGEAWLGVGGRENPRSFSKMTHKTPTIARAADGLGGTPWSGFSRRKCCRKVYTRCGRATHTMSTDESARSPATRRRNERMWEKLGCRQ
jgi:hypothetical protein